MPAHRAFAAAIFDATARDRIEPAAPGTIAAVAVQPVASPAPAAAPVLDTALPGWPATMIDRIERLRDEANAGDTRIRLHPDALGTVEIAVRQVGEALHVRFTAAEPETRQLLQDAQPQLARAAEDRGVTIARTEVSSGSGSGGQGSPSSQTAGQNSNGQPRPDPRPSHPGRPRPAPSPAAEPADDTRIA